MADPDISEGARELVDLTAEGVAGMGTHLAQIADIIAASVMPPKKGERGAARRMKEKLELYKAYCADVALRKADIEAKMQEDFVRLKEWRKETGTEGASMIEELEILSNKVRAQGKELEHERQRVANERFKIRQLILLDDRKSRRHASLAEAFVRRINNAKAETMMRAGLCSWVQCSFDNIRFRFKSAEEAARLKIEYHQKLRKSRAQGRLDVIQRERRKRALQACVLAMQEEAVEARQERHLEELRQRHEDAMVVMGAQLAQALGDEEKAKELVAEQVRRMEEAREQAREAERQRKLAERDARNARQDAEKARLEAKDAREAQAKAEHRADVAEADALEARTEAKDANNRAEASDDARIKAEQGQAKAEDEVKKKTKKMQGMQRMLAELGAESDSDAPPDERPPAFFINEDGGRVPRPRTRKERMGMAYREAESARWELRLGMAAMIDKDAASAMHVDRLRHELETSCREVNEVRRANTALSLDLEEALATVKQQESEAPFPNASTRPTEVQAPAHEYPLAPSSAAPPFDPRRPSFTPAPLVGASATPRLLFKNASQPALAPPLFNGPPLGQGGPAPERMTLAPLRKLKKPPAEWRVSWH